jgi:hypothetical protein
MTLRRSHGDMYADFNFSPRIKNSHYDFQNIKRKDFQGLERNLDALVQEVSMRSSRLFSRTISATCSSASVSDEYKARLAAASTSEEHPFTICERTIRDEDGVSITRSLTGCD